MDLASGGKAEGGCHSLDGRERESRNLPASTSQILFGNQVGLFGALLGTFQPSLIGYQGQKVKLEVQSRRLRESRLSGRQCGEVAGGKCRWPSALQLMVLADWRQRKAESLNGGQKPEWALLPATHGFN